MGGGSYSDSGWTGYRTRHIDPKKSAAEIFSSNMSKDLDPKNFKFREARDLKGEHPNSTPVIVALDVTGSMDSVLDYFAREGLATICKQVFERKAVKDPQLLVAAVGDFYCDDAPIQATQFESAIEPLAEQMQKIYFERGGGGNSFEGYSGVHFLAARRTVSDSFDKRNKKGYLFTIGDENPTQDLTKEQVETFFGDKIQDDLSPKELADMASRFYHVYHIIVKQGSNFGRETTRLWKDILGQNVIPVDDVKKIGEIITSVIQVNEGRSVEEVADSWDGTTGLAVRRALKDMSPTVAGKAGGVVRL